MPEIGNPERFERWEDQMHEDTSVDALAREFEERLTGKPDVPGPAITVRKRLCYDIAEALEQEFRLGTVWDLDRAASVVDTCLPLTHVEAAEQWDKLGGDHG